MQKLFLSACLLLAATIASKAADMDYSCIELSPLDGYPSKINSILVRNSGYTWVGSDDGIYFLTGGGRVTRFDSRTAAQAGWSFPGCQVFRVFEDPRGTVWALTDGGFSGYTAHFGSGVPDIIDGPGPGNPVFCATARGDMVYFGGVNCVWAYDHGTGTHTKLFSFDTPDPFPVTDIFFGKGDDLIIFNKHGQRPFIYDISANTFRRYDIDWKPGFFAAFMDSRKVLWLSEFGGGVSCFDSSGRRIATYSTANGLSSDIVLCFAERGGRLWMGTDGGGIDVLDPETGSVLVLDHEDDDPSSLPSSTITSIFIDSESRIWCGRQSGGIVILAQPVIRFYPAETMNPAASPFGFTSLCSTDDGNVWLGTGGKGLYRFDPAASEFTFCPATKGLNIYTMVQMDRKKLLLSCPNRGYFVYDTSSDDLYRFEGFNSSVNNYAADTEGASLATDETGRIISFSSGIERYDPSTGATEKYTLPPGMGLGGLHAVYGSGGRFFVDNLNLYRWNESAENKAELLHTFKHIYPIRSAVLSNGIVWLIAGYDMYRYDISGGRMDRYDISIPSRPMSICCDMSGRIWVGTRSNLFVFSPQDGKVISLGDVDGIRPNEYSPHGKLLTANGDFYLCGHNGLVHVPASTTFSSDRTPEPALSNFAVDGKPLSAFSSIAVPFRHGTIDMELFVTGRDILQSDMYRFHTEGPNRSMDTESSTPAMHFLKLPPGRYTVSASTNTRDGSWTQPVQVVSFKVRQPWYRTFPFYLVLAVLLVLIALAVEKMLHDTLEFERSMKADEERYNFLVNVSHELRTPLTLVLGPLAHLRNDKAIPSEQRTRLDNVFRQAEKMKTLLNTVLTTGRVQSGAITVEKVSRDFNEWARECAGTFADEATMRSMPIVFKPDTAAGTVDMDVELCQVVFSNMMINALKHNRKGLPITVRTESLPSDGMVRLCIRDHGAGIHGVDVGTIFEQYYQATEESTGFGIGLSYSKTIIDAHGGLIGAYNNDDDEGATFWFELPAKAGAARHKPASASVAATVPGGAASARKQAADLSGITVMFVDDDVELRKYMEEEFGNCFMKIVSASGGNEALALLKDTSPDIIISDVMMPEMDGIELCRRVKTDTGTSHIPFILLTARADSRSRSNGAAGLCDAYVTKPFDTSELLDTISKLIK